MRPVRRSEAVKVLGVDILRDLTLRDYAVAEREATSGEASARPDAFTTQQFLELLTSPRSIVITEKLARRRGYALGERGPTDGRRPGEHVRHSRRC